MTKPAIAKLLTALVILAALALAISRRSPVSQQSPATPQDAIYSMLDAARAGNTRAYLASYTGQMQSALNQTLLEKGEPAFKNYLQTANSEIKGVAVQEPKLISNTEAQLRVEYVYQDRNEAQSVYLEKRPEGWKIARVESAERIKTLVPYGTPVQ